jgi:hypothetical protein
MEGRAGLSLLPGSEVCRRESMLLDAIDTLLQEPAFDSAGVPASFAPAVEVCLAVLRSRFPRYAEFIDRQGNSERLPALFLPVLKSWSFPLPGELPIIVRLTSSGTTGRPSETPLDEPSWRRRVQAMRASYDAMRIFDTDLNVLAFLMDPTTTRMAGSLVIDAVLRESGRVRSLTYLARLGQAGPEFQPARAAAALADAAPGGPALLVGYPALIAAGIQALRQAGRDRFPLPEGSCILTGGGWKSFLPGVTLDQREFREHASAFFGVPPAAIRDMFGLSECPAVFVQCEHARYHVPAWCLAQAVDPETGRDVPPGQTGLLQLTVPLTTSYPLLKILTTDKVAIEPGCACGRAAPTLAPKGRVTAARFETCAMRIGRALAPVQGAA